MSVPEFAFSSAPLLAADAEISHWIEALAARECTPDDFVNEILQREGEDPEVAWEALALLDQQFRRDKLSHDIFINVKARLQKHSVSAVKTVDFRMPAAPAAAATAASPMPDDEPLHRRLQVGDALGERYRVVDVQRTDTGALVEAIDEHKINLPGIRKRVAIQVMDTKLSRSPALLPRLGNLQALSHPAIVRLLDVEQQDDALLLVMEFVSGASVQELLARNGGAIDVAVARRAVASMASALAYAHSQGVAHGDFGPTSVIVNHVGDAFLRDFQLQPDSRAAEPAADRLAFAWFAYELLTGSSASGQEHDRSATLRAPPGITREQWRVLRGTLTGKDGIRAEVLALFADEAPAMRRSAPATQAAGSPPRAGRSMGWLTGVVAAAALGSVAYLYLTAQPPDDGIAVADPAPVAAPSPPPAIAPAVERTSVQASAPAVTAPAATPDAAAASTRPRIDLTSDVTWVETTAPVARIWVRRRGDLKGEVSFKWWTESGSATADRDFRAVDTRMGIIPSGAKGTELLVPLVPDPQRREPRNFYVKIDAPGPRATLGARTLMQIAIVPPGYPAQRSTR